MKRTHGFTLIEVMVTAGIIAFLAGITIVAVNPAKHMSEARNAQRATNLGSIQGAINHYTLDSAGTYPAGIDGTLRMLGSATTGCAVSCGQNFQTPLTGLFNDDNSADFSTGTYHDTWWNTASSAVTLNTAGLTARTGWYRSGVKDAGANQTWMTFTWTPSAPYNKELPNNAASETAYPSGNAVMTGNVLLMHMNESSGTITDSSGGNRNGTVTGGVNYGVSGKLRTGLGWNGGANTYVSVPHSTALNLPNTGGTVMIWINPTITTGSIPQNTGMGVIRKPDYGPNIYSPGGYGIEVYRNLTSSPANIRAYLGWNSGVPSSQQVLTGTATIANNTWHHVALTWNATTMNIYVNGVLDATATRTSGPLNWSSASPAPVYLGHNGAAISGAPPSWYTGSMDEAALFSRELSATEIRSAYERGAFRLRAQLRTCDDVLCNGETLKGPSGSSSDYYEEINNTGLGLPTFAITNQLINRYFQYDIFFDTDTSSYGPGLRTVLASNSADIPGGDPTTENTAEACLNLSSTLTPTYLTEIPVDPQTGSASRTYYAAKKLGRDNLIVRACSPELGESIQIEQ
jgi:prepilin-type N-terminal cleavage/methylation domain-containing protein